MKKILILLTVILLAGCTVQAKSTGKIWSGEWNEGSITVPQHKNYSVFKIDVEYGSFVACRSGEHIEGGGFYGFNVENALASYAANIIVNGDTLTLETARYVITQDGLPPIVQDSDMKIIAIYGLY